MPESKKIAVHVEHISKRYYIGQYSGRSLLRSARNRWKWLRQSSVQDSAPEKSDRIMALDDVSFDVYEGDSFGIIGRNGAGKSTLLKLICEITTPTSGSIDIYGRISSMLEVGSGFDKELTGRENIYLNGTILGMTEEEIDSKIDEIIAFSELGEFIDTPVKRYSSGMYTKLAFSVAASLDNEIIIIDEILAVGDVAFREKCLDKIKSKVSDGRTVLYVGHNMDYLKKLCDKCIVLDKGRLVFQGDAEDAVQFYLDNIEKDAQNQPGKNPDAPARNPNPVFLGTQRDVRDKERSPLLTQRKMHMTWVEYPGRSDIFFSRGEKAVMRYRWDVLQDYQNLCMRLEVWTASDKHQASYVLYDIGDGTAGQQKELTIEVGLDYFVPGLYKFKQTFFFRSEDGMINTDRVIGLSFEIRKETDEYWEPKKMSNIKLENVRILDQEW